MVKQILLFLVKLVPHSSPKLENPQQLVGNNESWKMRKQIPNIMTARPNPKAYFPVPRG